MDSSQEKKGLSKKEAEEAIDEILLKKAAGQPLDKREELVLAYLWYVPGCHHKECQC